MGLSVGGDITEITFNHPSLGSGTIFPKAGEDSTYDLGGVQSVDDDGMIDGSGGVIDQMTSKRWNFAVVVAWDANLRKDLEAINALGASPVPATWTFTNINGTVYQGIGKPVGDQKGNGNKATFPLKVAGGNGLKKIL